MRPTPTILAATATLSTALPTTPISPRAGAPYIIPIPPTCTITNPLPPCPSSIPAPTTQTLYTAYYPSFTTNTTAMALQCLQQCYGYGNHTQCKSAFWAENMVTPQGYYGSQGGQLQTACLLFGRELKAGDFVGAPEGQGTGGVAGNIFC
ncbi:hypothetical protein BDW02DRAFT_643382 [Decorospora gaudefroyi]|uniref:Uncharacterized protein n=1 Tax=Decorospora gaudefroyi TaxID=184978 RepID=A0A6A5K210_9PLEO|nr:hypothetical protein BDW02DRAFT_643382 [Decorospora gaudefroyi]